MKIAQCYEVPDECPIDCPFKPELEDFSQGIICTRCPVFCCGRKFPLVDKEAYRAEWAAEWSKWFKGDKKYYPELKIFPERY